MGIVIFGHGGLDPIAVGKGMEWIALPAGTSLQFYADAGQILLTDATTWENWKTTFTAPWPAIDSTGVSYNLELFPLNAKEQGYIDGLTDFPHTIFMIGRDVDRAQLCTGDATTCPSDPRMITGVVDGPRTHSCGGLLARFAGQELHWIACSGIDGFDDEAMAAVAAARGDAPENVWAGVDPDSWMEQVRATVRDYPDYVEAYLAKLTPEQLEQALTDPEVKAAYDAIPVDSDEEDESESSESSYDSEDDSHGSSSSSEDGEDSEHGHH